VRAPELADGLTSIRHSRGERAMRIAAQLDAAGVTGELAGSHAARWKLGGSRPQPFRPLPGGAEVRAQFRRRISALSRHWPGRLRASLVARRGASDSLDPWSRRPNRFGTSGSLSTESSCYAVIVYGLQAQWWRRG
jgi:hypothetical protein